METRKVQKVGYSTISVSLPTKWVKQNSIQPGDLVFLDESEDGILKVLPSRLANREVDEEYVIDADVCNRPNMLQRLILGSYALGHDVIRITSSNRISREHVDEIRTASRRLIGLGILEESPKNILLQCAIDPLKFKIDMIVRRLAILTLTMLSEATDAFVGNQLSLAEEVIKRENEANSIYYLGVRLTLSAQSRPEIIHPLGIESAVMIPAIRLVLQSLELIADYAEDIAEKAIRIGENRGQVPEDILRKFSHYGEIVKNGLQIGIESVFSRNFVNASKMLEKNEEIEEEIETVVKEFPVIPYLRAILYDFVKISDVGTTIVEIAINGALLEPEKYLKGVVKAIRHEKSSVGK